jgi:tryptophan-rich sensory protein
MIYHEDTHRIDFQRMALPRWMVPSLLVLLMIDAIIELSFISSMVAWLHSTAGGEFEVIAPDSQDTLSFNLHGKPKNLLLNQGHTSNGAAGTAFVLIGLGGILVLTLHHHASTSSKAMRLSTVFYFAWLVSTVLSALLTLAALAYTFAVTNATRGQSIDVALAASLDSRPYPNYVAYPIDDWTPETWFEAVLELTLVDRSLRSDIEHHLTIMRGWKWNLIPLFLLGLTFSVVAILDAWLERKNNKIVRGEKFEPVRGQEEGA